METIAMLSITNKRKTFPHYWKGIVIAPRQSIPYRTIWLFQAPGKRCRQTRLIHIGGHQGNGHPW